MDSNGSTSGSFFSIARPKVGQIAEAFRLVPTTGLGGVNCLLLGIEIINEYIQKLVLQRTDKQRGI